MRLSGRLTVENQLVIAQQVPVSERTSWYNGTIVFVVASTLRSYLDILAQECAPFGTTLLRLAALSPRAGNALSTDFLSQ